MSQHDFNIANQTFPSFRADLNDALVAAATMSAGSSAPTTPYAYQLWFDTTTGTWKVRNSGNTAWISTITTDLATGNVGIGTSSPNTNAEIVGGSTGSTTNLLQIRSNASTANTGSTIRFTNSEIASTTYGAAEITALRIDVAGDTDLVFKPSKAGTISEAMRIQGDTGNVGIGVTPEAKLHISSGGGIVPFASSQIVSESTGNNYMELNGGSTSTTAIYFGDPSDQDAGGILYNHSNDSLSFRANAASRMLIDNSGNVGINTTTTLGAKLFVSQGAAASPATSGNMTTGVVIGAGTGSQALNVGTDADGAWYNAAFANNAGVARIHRWLTGGTERMRIDSSGNLLVGTTDSTVYNNGTNTSADTGINLNTTYAGFARYNGTPMYVNRTGSDGNIIAFNKSGSTVGVISSQNNGDLAIGQTNTGFLFNDAGNQILPFDPTNGTSRDNIIDLGSSGNRFDDIFATNGTIQTSDANEKQQIAALTDAEITAAKAISALFKTFKWNDSVAEKGDAARTHTGVIAQDVEAAMTAAGLDAGDYAFFISTTWWETQTEVPAVEAVEAVYEDVVIPAVLDDDGNEVEAERTEQRTVTEAVEAVEAYTRTDTYDTAEEAPEGATERNRKGIRYPELMAFVGAATEQRLASIETRLAALEA